MHQADRRGPLPETPYRNRLKEKQEALEEAKKDLATAQEDYERAIKELQLAIDGKDPE
jgi:peptidoglycan hydrolase CwlO-like protein